MTLNEAFDCIYYINLAKRTDRREQIESQLYNLNIVAERWNATKGNPWGWLPNMLANEAGCLDSHYKLLKHLEKKQVKSALILEDDAVFVEDFNFKFYEFYRKIKEWDMLYLSVNFNEVHPAIGKINQKIDKNVIKINYGLTTAAYAVKGSLIPILLEEIEKNISNTRRVNPIDIVYALYHPNIKVFAAYPNLIKQAPGWSDVRSEYVDYKELVK